MYFKKLIHPEYYQGNKKKDNYFEGWYYKLVSDNSDYTLALIPGISKNKLDPHAFIQVFISKTIGDDTKLSSQYFKYDLKEFDFSHKNFWVRIDRNYFSKSKLSLDLKNDQIKLFGTVSIHNTVPIKKSIFTPNIMGLFGYLGFMECYHGVISMTHQLDGLLKINDEIVSFKQSKGYIEKDWGKSFPREYVWLQSNHFSNPNTSLMFSYADIPFLGFYFKGLIANLIVENKEYRFATYNFSKILKEEIEANKVHYLLKKGKYKLDVVAESKTSLSLQSPKNGMMINQIKEGLSGYIHIKLYKKEKLIYEDIGKNAGIEIMKNR